MGKVFRMRQVVAAPSASASSSSASASSRVNVAALKIVDDAHGGLHITALQREAEQVESLTTQPRLALLSPDAVAVLPRILQPFTLAHEPGALEASAAPIGAAVLFEPVGKSVADATHNKVLWLEVCEAMLTLHLAGIVHGDPRLPNLIRVPDDTPRAGATATRTERTAQLTSRLVWIDFCAAGRSVIAADCRICLESFFGCNRDFATDELLVTHIERYAERYQQLVQSFLKPQAQRKETWDSLVAAAHEAMSEWRQAVWQDGDVNLERS